MLISSNTGTGNGLMVSFSVVVSAPLLVVTITTPDVALLDTYPVMDVALLTVYFEAVSVPSFTLFTFVKFVPVIVTASPWQTVAGENEVMVGACANTTALFNKHTITKNIIILFVVRQFIMKVAVRFWDSSKDIIYPVLVRINAHKFKIILCYFSSCNVDIINPEAKVFSP